MFEKTGHRDKISFGSVISTVSLLRVKVDNGSKKTLRLPEKEKKRVESLLLSLKNGLQLSMTGTLVEVIGKRGKVTHKLRGSRKRKMESKEPTRKQKVPPKIKKRKLDVSVKMFVDKNNPNWRLKANTTINVWEKDPLFESKEKVPFVSSLAQSKLAIRAVLLNDMKLLEQVVKDNTKVHHPLIKRSLGNNMSALSYALRTENLEAVRILLKTKMKSSRVGLPPCSLATSDTGTYNYR